MRLGDPASEPLVSGLLGDSGEIGTGLAEVGEAPIVDLMAGVAAIKLDHGGRARDLFSAWDGHLTGMTLDAGRLVVGSGVHRRLEEVLGLPTVLLLPTMLHP